MTPEPFLVARGRRLGYRTLLAPAVLVSAGEQGLLSDSVPPSDAEDEPRVITVRTRSGRTLAVVHATHRVRAADLDEPEDPADEHGRPLDLLYGYVLAASTARPSVETLHEALLVAFGVYRLFLADEEGTSVTTARPLAPVSTANPAEAPRKGEPVAPEGPVRDDRTLRVVALAAVVAAVIVVLVAVLLVGMGDESPPVEPTPTVSTSSPGPP